MIQRQRKTAFLHCKMAPYPAKNQEILRVEASLSRCADIAAPHPELMAFPLPLHVKNAQNTADTAVMLP
jgi:hypothetical protein